MPRRLDVRSPSRHTRCNRLRSWIWPTAHDELPVGSVQDDLPDVVTSAAGTPQRLSQGKAAHGAAQRRPMPRLALEGAVEELEEETSTPIARQATLRDGSPSNCTLERRPAPVPRPNANGRSGERSVTPPLGCSHLAARVTRRAAALSCRLMSHGGA